MAGRVVKTAGAKAAEWFTGRNGSGPEAWHGEIDAAQLMVCEAVLEAQAE